MGVRGLTTYIDSHPELSIWFKLHDSLVIIDGYNLSHTLYFTNQIDSVYGGDYEKYGSLVSEYFLAFLECNIKPIVIFDGGYEERKLKTLISRCNDRLRQVQNIARYGKRSKVMPILAHKVFISVLNSLGIPYAQSDYEADDQITALANYYNCPVISNDSDFYIFDVHCGFIRLDSIRTGNNGFVDSKGKKHKYLKCKIYYIGQFLSRFPGLDRKVLPLLGSLIGNDYVEGYELDDFFIENNISISGQEKIVDLLRWLQNNTANKAFKEVNKYLKGENRESIKCMVEDSVCGYKLNNYSLSSVIDKKLHSKRKKLPLLSSRLSTRCGTPLPTEFVDRYHRGQLPDFFVNVITHHKVFLLPQVGNMDFLNSYTCSRYIRQILYGILVRHNTKSGNCESECCFASVEEYGRQGEILDLETVEPIFSLEGFGTLPNINEIYHLRKEKRMEIIFKTLGITKNFASHLPEEWQLFIGCINYWLRNNDAPCSSEAFVYALILSLIYFDLIKYRSLFPLQRTCRNIKPLCLTASNSGRKNKLTIPTCTCSISCILSNVSKCSFNTVKEIFENYSMKPLFDADSLHIIHAYSQLQACILTVIFLNDLLGNFLINPEPELCFNGSMLLRLTKIISSYSYPGEFVEEMLGQDTNLYWLFIQLVSKVCENVPNFSVLQNRNRKNKKRTKICQVH